MFNFQAVTPAVVYAPHVFSEHRTVIGTRLFRILAFSGVTDPMRMFRSVTLRQITGVGHRCHCRQFCPGIRSHFPSYCSSYGTDRIMETIGSVTAGMASRKLLLTQASLIRTGCPQSPETKGKIIADTDVTSVQSSSSGKEGAEAGYNKKTKENGVLSFLRPLSENFSPMRSCFRVAIIRVIFAGEP